MQTILLMEYNLAKLGQPMMKLLLPVLTAAALAIGAVGGDWAQSPVFAQNASSGQISGQVKHLCGVPLSTELQAQLVNSEGLAVSGMRVPVGPEGRFMFSNVPPGAYTVHAVDNDGIQAMSAVILATDSALSTVLTVGTGKCGAFWKNKTTLAVVGAAAAGGTSAIIATRDEASGSR